MTCPHAEAGPCQVAGCANFSGRNLAWHRGLSGDSPKQAAVIAAAAAEMAQTPQDWENQEGARLTGSQSFAESQIQGQQPNPAPGAMGGPPSAKDLALMEAVMESGEAEFVRDLVEPAVAALTASISRLEREFQETRDQLRPVNTWGPGNIPVLVRLAQIEKEVAGLRWLYWKAIGEGSEAVSRAGFDAGCWSNSVFWGQTPDWRRR